MNQALLSERLQWRADPRSLARPLRPCGGVCPERAFLLPDRFDTHHRLMARLRPDEVFPKPALLQSSGRGVQRMLPAQPERGRLSVTEAQHERSASLT